MGGQLGQLGNLEGGQVRAVEVRPQVGLDQVGQVVRRDLGNWSDWSGERESKLLSLQLLHHLKSNLDTSWA